MKPTIHAAVLTTLTAALTIGCSSPSARHDVRVDRRGDVVERSGDRIDSRQENRDDRRTDRQDRVDTRY